jgi:PelA/Pel-15E family pectate lyase
LYKLNIISRIFVLPFLFACFSFSQDNSQAFSVEGFYDSAHHWYDINDEEKMIYPLTGQKKYDSSEVTKIADNVLLFQKNNGGWPKNYDMRAILTEEQKAAVLKAKDATNTTFDNGATHSQIQYLAEAFTETKIERYRKACIKGIEFILEAQYNNGGWPQFYPDTSGYRKYITYNDDAMVGTMGVLLRIVKKSPEYFFVNGELYERVKKAFQKGIDCILKTQIKENGVLTAWCQQHDNIDFHPQNARTFEPAAICNEESADLVKMLMLIDNPDDRIINSIQSAVKWFNESKIPGIRIKRIKAPKVDYKYHSTSSDVIVVNDPGAPPIWTRFYELGTHRPMFCRRDKKIVYKLSDVERERRTGYTWYVYSPQAVLDLYPEWQKMWAPEENVLE